MGWDEGEQIANRPYKAGLILITVVAADCNNNNNNDSTYSMEALLSIFQMWYFI